MAQIDRKKTKETKKPKKKKKKCLHTVEVLKFSA